MEINCLPENNGDTDVSLLATSSDPDTSRPAGILPTTAESMDQSLQDSEGSGHKLTSSQHKGSTSPTLGPAPGLGPARVVTLRHNSVILSARSSPPFHPNIAEETDEH